MNERENIAKSLIGTQDTFLIDNNNIESMNKTMRLNVDPLTQKKLRAMKYVNNSQSIKLETNRIDEIKRKQEIEGKFYKTLTYVQKAKDLKKSDILGKMITDNSNNNLSVSLIAGKPHYVYFLVHNSFVNEEIMQLVVTKPEIQEETKNSVIKQDPKEKDGLTQLRIINDPAEWKFVCESEQLTKPQDYNLITAQNYVLVKADEVVPVLIKITSFDVNMSNGNYQIWVNQKNGTPIYCLNVTLVKVVNLVDHVFNFSLPDNKNSTIKLNNPFKQDPYKTDQIKKNYYCTDSRVHLEIDTVTDDFYFKYPVPDEGSHRELNFYFYTDKYQSMTVLNWRVNVFSLIK